MIIFVRACPLVFVLFAGCATHVAHSVAPPSKQVAVLGTVEKICAGCDIVDLVNGGAVEWDVVTVRITSPETLAGTAISVEVLVEGDGIAQRKTYPQSARVAFSAAQAAIDARRVMLHLTDIKATN